MADEAEDFEARREKLKELEQLLQQGEVPMLRCNRTEGFDDLPFLMVNGAHYESCLPGTVHSQKGLEPAFSLDKACEISPNHVHIKIPGRNAVCFADISDAETIGTLTREGCRESGGRQAKLGVLCNGASSATRISSQQCKTTRYRDRSRSESAFHSKNGHQISKDLNLIFP